MDHYQDIHLLPDPEFNDRVLLNALFSKLHRALFDLQSQDIGVSFPAMDQARFILGTCLRLHGTGARLEQLSSLPWLSGMRDHVDALSVASVPPATSVRGHRVVRRVQVKSGVERQRRRCMKRHNVSMEEACSRIPDSAAKVCTLPYMQLRSHSSGHPFKLFVEHGDVKPAPSPGVFTQYGLSKGATIPWF